MQVEPNLVIRSVTQPGTSRYVDSLQSESSAQTVELSRAQHVVHQKLY